MMKKFVATLAVAGVMFSGGCSEENTTEAQTNRGGSTAQQNAPRQQPEQRQRIRQAAQPSMPLVPPLPPDVTAPVGGQDPAPEILPTPVVATTYTVKSGDTYQAIARKYTGRNSTWPALQQLNRIEPTKLMPGQVLKLPPEWMGRSVPTGTSEPSLTSGTTVTVASTIPQTPASTWTGSSVVATTRLGSITKSYYATPTANDLQTISRSLASGQQTWRTDGLEVAKTAFADMGIQASGSLWKMLSTSGTRMLVVHWTNANVTSVELSKDTSGIWYPVASTTSPTPLGYSASDFDSHAPALKAQLLKSRVRWN